MSRGTATDRNGERTRADLIDAATRLLERGEEPTMRAVAGEAGVGERTIYRYFDTRTALHEAVVEHVSPRLGVALCDSVDGLLDYIARLFAVFDDNRALTVSTVTAPWAQPDLARSRSDNLRALTSLLRAAFPAADTDDLASAAAALRTVVSGSGWVYQRESCALPNATVIAHAQWLATALLDRLAQSSGSAPPGTTLRRRRRRV